MKYFYSLIILCFLSFHSLSQISVKITLWGDNYNQPLCMVPWINDDFILIEKGGLVKTVDEDGNKINTILDLSDYMGATGGERGLLGLALHPDYPDSAYI